MEESGSWRGEVDRNLKRLHSLMFGVDLAIERGDFPPLKSSVSLSSDSSIRALLVTPKRRSSLRFDKASARSSTSLADLLRPKQIGNCSFCFLLVLGFEKRMRMFESQVFELVKKEPGHLFVKGRGVDVEKMKQSKLFKAFVQQYKGSGVDEMKTHSSLDVSANRLQIPGSREDKSLLQSAQTDRQHDIPGSKFSKLTTQTKLTSFCGSKISKANNSSSRSPVNLEMEASEECTIVEKVQSDYQNHGKTRGVPAFLQAEEEEKTREHMLLTKRAHVEFSSPRIENAKSPQCNGETNVSGNGFVTARVKLEIDAAKLRHGLGGSPSSSVSPQSDNNSAARAYGVRPGGFSRRSIRSNFVPPIRSNCSNGGHTTSRSSGKCDDGLDDTTKRWAIHTLDFLSYDFSLEMLYGPDGELPEKLRNLEPRLLEHVSNEIMDRDPNVRWDDIAGLEHAKKCVTEMVIWPLLRPDIFKGCRSPGRGLLLFGPPGTGKTMIGKAIAGEAKATFFYISASSLTSKWIGEGEKLVRALFGVASCRQPAVIFVDEIDSLLSQRKSEGEHESSRRLKTQFLIEMEGFDSGNEQILLIGATNRPQELDEAARRRLTKRLYIPLPSSEARAWIIRNLLENDGLFKLSKEDTDCICKLTEGYSGSDMKNLVKDASMGPLREALKQGIQITNLKKEDMRSVTIQDFESALQEVRPSVSLNELGTYEEWNKQFGSLSL
ncbi:hypothetical protein Syun_024479 [Stephania yunnanensis]|uniref:AAA+ ATPase domain-containing protein n=1 Tax=Stephania yunnanensis TaxID=152371 RepID=A0AAP0I4H7_9MAGN